MVPQRAKSLKLGYGVRLSDVNTKLEETILSQETIENLSAKKWRETQKKRYFTVPKKKLTNF